MQHAKRVFALLLTLVAVAGLAACGSDDDDTTTGSATTEATTQEAGGGRSSGDGKQAEGGDDEASTTLIVVRNGEPVGGIAELEYDAGEQVKFQVRSNTADEVHVHGYDVEEEIPAGGVAKLSFAADIEGIFEVELHESEKQIAELRVNP